MVVLQEAKFMQFKELNTTAAVDHDEMSGVIGGNAFSDALGGSNFGQFLLTTPCKTSTLNTGNTVEGIGAGKAACPFLETLGCDNLGEFVTGIVE
jgi:hypothetical protein